MNNDPIEITTRQVWAANLDKEFILIRHSIDQFPNVSMDTEFPGVYFRHNYKNRESPKTHYSILKQNVDVLKIIQVGLTLTDSQGNLPDLGTINKRRRFIWQFNFKDFDVARDFHAPDSVDLLRQNGVDFDLNRKIGIDSVKFAELMMSSGLVCNESITWVTFHCAYDFGYLVRVLTQLPLPDNLNGYMLLIKLFFGENVYDVKYMIKFCDGLYGGLNKIAKALNQDREVGCSHQSGSDSLLTWRVFKKICDVYFSNNGGRSIGECAGHMFGFELSPL